MKLEHIILIFFIALIVGFSNNAHALEKDYVNKHCSGQIEVVLADRTRVDCLTSTHAIEYDYGRNFYQAVGQSLHYAMFTGKRAGIVLIINDSELRFYNRAEALINHYGLPIDLWGMTK